MLLDVSSVNTWSGVVNSRALITHETLCIESPLAITQPKIQTPTHNMHFIIIQAVCRKHVPQQTPRLKAYIFKGSKEQIVAELYRQRSHDTTYNKHQQKQAKYVFSKDKFNKRPKRPERCYNDPPKSKGSLRPSSYLVDIKLHVETTIGFTGLLCQQIKKATNVLHKTYIKTIYSCSSIKGKGGLVCRISSFDLWLL